MIFAYTKENESSRKLIGLRFKEMLLSNNKEKKLTRLISACDRKEHY